MTTRRGLGAVLATAAFRAHAQRAEEPWPTRPVRLVVPYPPGGTTDLLARPYGEFLRQRLGQPVVLDNRPGASTNVGGELVARAEPNGYTLLLGQSSMIGNQVTGPVPTFNAMTALAPISLVARVPYLLCANPAFPPRTLAEAMALIRRSPGRYRVGSAQLDFQVAVMARSAGLDIEHISYRGGAQATTDAVAGQVEMVLALVPVLLGLVRDGALRPLGVTSAHRSRVLPDVPSFRETGESSLDSGTWYAAFAPAGTPTRSIERVAEATADFVADRASSGRMRELGYDLEASTPERLHEEMLSSAGQYARLVQELGWQVPGSR